MDDLPLVERLGLKDLDAGIIHIIEATVPKMVAANGDLTGYVGNVSALVSQQYSQKKIAVPEGWESRLVDYVKELAGKNGNGAQH